MTGWQGLASFYEKQLSAVNETDVENRTKIASQLSETYGKMLTVTKDADKFENLSEKLVDVNLKVLKNLDGVVSTLKSRISFMESLNEKDRTRQAHSELVRILNTQQIGELTPTHDKVLKESLEKVNFIFKYFISYIWSIVVQARNCICTSLCKKITVFSKLNSS